MLDARRKACLTAMGIELWKARAGDRRLNDDETVLSSTPPADDLPYAETSVSEPPPWEASTSPDVESGFSESMDDGQAALPVPGGTGLRTSDLSWEALQDKVSNCRACELHKTRTQTVFGVGDPRARLMIIGEAPGADEDRQGEPFVGRAGQLLNPMLEAIGFRRDQVYIANIIKCRPPGNRDPRIEEAAACQGYLHRQINLIEPDLILSVGRVSAHNLLNTDLSVGRMRGRVHRFQPGDIPLIVTYHPAYLLRRPQEKAKAWQDLQLVHRELQAAAESK